jgi:hypothetical protein
VNIEAFCLCKAVTVNTLKEQSLIDIFDVKIAAGEPILVDSFLVASSIRVFRSDEGQHRFSITCTDPHGKVFVGPAEIVSFSDLPRDSLTYFYVMTMPPAEVSFGRYDFALEIDGVKRAATFLYIEKGSTRQ